MTIRFKSVISAFTVLCVAAGFAFPNPDAAYAQLSDIEEGNEAYRTLQFREALEKYNQAVSRNPGLKQDRIITLKRGMAAFGCGEFETALTLLEHAQSLGSAYSDYVDFYIALAAVNLGRYESAAQSLTRLAQEYPASLVRNDALYTAGYIQHLREKFRESNLLLVPLENARSAAGRRTGILYYTGVNYIKLAQPAEGCARLMQAITASPADTFALKAAGVLVNVRSDRKEPLSEKEMLAVAAVYTGNNKIPQAERLISDYFKRFPAGSLSGRAYFERGRIRFSRGHYTRAAEDFTKAFPLMKEPALIRESRLYIARCAARRGDWRGANQEYERYAREYPSDKKAAESLWIVGLNYERNGELLEAAQVYERLARKTRANPYRDRAAFKTGFCWYKNDYLTKSSQHFNRLRRQYPGTDLGMQAAFWEAKALEKLDKPQEAQAVFENLAQRNTRNYYVIAARERLRKDAAFTPDSTALSPAAYAPELRRKIEIGVLFGEPWGSGELRRYRRTAGTGKQALVTLHQAYTDIGAYDEAIKLADLLYNRYYYNTTNRAVFQALYPDHFRKLLKTIPDARAVDNALIFGLIRRESLFEYQAVSFSGARGLMQLMPSTAQSLARTIGIERLDFDEVFQPHTNMRLGIRNLRELLQRFRRNIPAALAAYNAGDAAVRRWMKRYGTDDRDEFIENIEFLETYVFVKEVIKNYYYYRRLYPDLTTDN